MQQLNRAIAEITEIAVGFGLDFYPMRYEICPPDIIYTFGAYGMPTRFSHWSFGKTFIHIDEKLHVLERKKSPAQYPEDQFLFGFSAGGDVVQYTGRVHLVHIKTLVPSIVCQRKRPSALHSHMPLA
jgi:hypothetical protein